MSSQQVRTVEFLSLDTADTGEARAHNRDLLRDGVVGIKCVEVREPTPAEHQLYKPYLPPFSRMSNVESYLGGSKNTFVRDWRGIDDPNSRHPHDVAFGFIKVRV